MQAYVAHTPRAAIAAAALAATAAIVAFSVVVPAKLDAGRSAHSAAAPVEVVVLPKHIVIGARDTTVVSAQGADLRGKTKQQI